MPLWSNDLLLIHIHLHIHIHLQKLYTYAGNKDGYKALVAAQYANVKIDIPPFRMGVDNKSDDFYEMSPRGQVREREKMNLLLCYCVGVKL